MDASIINYVEVWKRVIDAYALSLSSEHGPSHWKRVERNGLKLAEKTGARIDVVRLFAVFHDSKRLNECNDPQHGPRGAEFARELRNVVYEIDDEGFALLFEACFFHTGLNHSPNPTIGTCLDADRLDLGRVGIMPDPQFMSTLYGKELCVETQT